MPGNRPSQMKNIKCKKKKNRISWRLNNKLKCSNNRSNILKRNLNRCKELFLSGKEPHSRQLKIVPNKRSRFAPKLLEILNPRLLLHPMENRFLNLKNTKNTLSSKKISNNSRKMPKTMSTTHHPISSRDHYSFIVKLLMKVLQLKP